MQDASPHLAGLLDSQYEALLAHWSARAAESPHGFPELGPHVPALLRQLIGELAVAEGLAPPPAAPLPPDFDLEAVVLGYGLLQRLVLELLEGASVPVSMRDVRRLGDWFTRAVAAAAAAFASQGEARRGAPAAPPQGEAAARDAPEDTLRSAGQSAPSGSGAASATTTASEAHPELEAVFLQAPVAIAIVRGPELSVELANGMALELLGDRGAADIVGRPLLEALPELASGGLDRILGGVLTTGRAFIGREVPVPVRSAHAERELRFFDVVYAPLRDPDGHVARVVAVGTDVTESVRLREQLTERADVELRQSEARLSLLGDAAFIGTWVMDVATEQVSADPQVLRLFGLPQQGSHPVQAYMSRVAPLFRERIAALLRAALRGESGGYIQAEFRTLDMEHGLGPWVEARAQVTLGADGQAVRLMGTVADITGRKAAEVERERLLESERRAREQAQRVSRLESEFIATISHEFRTPLTLLLGPAADALASPERRLEGRPLELLHENALRLLELTDALLELARIEAGQADLSFEPVDVSALTAALAARFQPLIEGAGLGLEVRCPPLSERCFVDRRAWTLVVANLLSNAFKFTFSGAIQVSLEPRDGQLELSVTDTGTGIAEAELELVFERFHRVAGARGRSFEGTGIGLALVRELARLHGGNASAESRLGQGSRFSVRIPLGSAHLPPERVRAAPSADEAPLAPVPSVKASLGWRPELRLTQDAPRPAAAGVRGHIVLADDNADMREYVSQLLAGGGWSVHAVSDGRAALESALERTPDLVLSDVTMPRLDGFELAAALARHEATRGVPLILLSANGGQDAARASAGPAPLELLIKPFSGRELLARVGARVDVTRRERELVSAHERWRALLMQAPVAVSVVHGPDFVYELANPAALALLGGRDVVGKTVRQASAEAGLDPPERELLEQVYHGGQPLGVEEHPVALASDGRGATEEAFFKLSCQPIRDGAGEVREVLTVAVDVSAQVHARRGAEARLAERMAAERRQGELLELLARELQGPLGAIGTALSLFDPAASDPLKAARHRDVARRQLGQLVQLVDDVLDVARLGHGELELRQQSVDLDVLLQHALAATRPAVEARQHELHVTIAAGTFRSRADGARLTQTLVHLLASASQRAEPGSALRVTLEREQTAVGLFARLSVRDAGRGPSREVLGERREPGLARSPVPERGDALGLGLTLVQRVAEKHGGSLSAGGGQIELRLPLSGGGAEEPRELAAGRSEPAPRPQRVVLVEDSEDVRELLEECIRDLGHQVSVAANGLDGAATITRELPTVALVDVGLRGIDGYEVARRVRAAPGGRDVRLVALSGYGSADVQRTALAAGFDLHVEKPIELERLRQVLASEPPPARER